jgi:hypothetical protein
MARSGVRNSRFLPRLDELRPVHFPFHRKLDPEPLTRTAERKSHVRNSSVSRPERAGNGKGRLWPTDLRRWCTLTRARNDEWRNAPRQELTRDDLADIARLLAEIISLHSQLAAARLRAANLEAVMRAALRAHWDGEADPLSYLRDEIGNYPGGVHGA